MNIASIDIGSNTVLLLIVKIDKTEKKIESLYNDYRIPRISKGLSAGSEISEDKIDELISVLTEYKRIIKEYNCEQSVIKATNAMRIAVNSHKIIDKIKDMLDLTIEIIPGEEEARLSYLGAKSTFKDFDKFFVLDIGGGSTEIIKGIDDNLEFRKSFPIGAVNLSEMLIDAYPVSPIIQSNLDSELEIKLNELNSIAVPELPLVAVAGTPTSLYCMMQQLRDYDEKLVEGSIIEYNHLLYFSKKLSYMTPDQIKTEFGKVVVGREDVIYTGSKILLKVMELLKQNRIYVSGRGLRYGSVVDFISMK